MRNMRKISEDGFENLKFGIVRQACKDYVRLDRELPTDGSYSKREITEFFRSAWFSRLCPNLDGERILAELKSHRLTRKNWKDD